MTKSRERILVIDDQIGRTGSPENEDFLLDYASLTSEVEFLFEDSSDKAGGYSSEPALEAILGAGRIDLVLLDVKFGSETDRLGFEILERIAKDFPGLPVVMMTSLDRDVANLSRTLEPGAFAFVSKRPPPGELRRRIREVLDLARDYAIRGSSTPIRHLRREIARIAPYDTVPILILGERGTGKERVSRYIHQNGPRRDGPFVALSCAELNENLVESGLFGHEAGAFTGASKSQKGRLERAHGGTLFLDELGEIPLTVQIKLLRVLEERRFSPVGSVGREVAFDVQLISATNANLDELVRIGKLREDFLDRVSAFVVRTPALREYPEDIPELVSYFLTRVPAASKKTVTSDVLELLKRFAWPGNGRELDNVVRRAAIKAGDSSHIDVDCLPDGLCSAARGNVQPTVVEAKAPALPYWPNAERSHLRAEYLSEVILRSLVREADDVGGNAAAIMRDMFPGQLQTKRYLGQVIWKLVDWNPRLLGDTNLRPLLQQTEALWSAFTSYLRANELARRKLWDKMHRLGIKPPEL